MLSYLWCYGGSIIDYIFFFKFPFNVLEINISKKNINITFKDSNSA